MAVEGVRFGHVNVIADGWRRLAQLYETVFGCEPVRPERGYAGRDLERGTAVPRVRLRGVRARIPA